MKFFEFFRRKPVPDQQAVVPETLPNGIQLSPELSAHRSLIEKTAIPFVQIRASPAENLSVVQSKFGGRPYWPTGMPYPTDEEEVYMFLLAQLNFSEIPHLKGYPEKGVLQFYISTNDVYGLNFDHPTAQTSFRVVYFEDVDEAGAEKDFFFLNEINLENVPLSQTMGLQFSLQTDYVGACDVRFEENFGSGVLHFTKQFGEKEDSVSDELFNTFLCEGHKIGGYAYFTQTDPREDYGEYKDWILLLQIDSQDNDIVWGDVGVANFFIHPEALRRKDFSNVLYNWDCT